MARRLALALILLPALASGGEPVGSVADIAAHDRRPRVLSRGRNKARRWPVLSDGPFQPEVCHENHCL